MIVNALPEDVTWFTSDQLGAQQMMGHSNGDLLRVLDDCLVNGWNEISAEGVIAENDYVTLTFSTGHGFLQNQIIVIEGAVNPQLNGSHRAKRLTPTTIDIDVSGVVDETGIITAKIKPLGWESIFGATDTLKRAYRSLSPNSTKRVIYLDMTIPVGSGYSASEPVKRAVVSVCSDMQVLGEQIGSLTDSINNFPTHINGSLFWYQKRNNSKTGVPPNTASKWKVVGNKDFFYLLISWSAFSSLDGTNRADVFGFGEFDPLSADQDTTFLMSTYFPNDDGFVFTGTQGAKMGTTANSALPSMAAYCFNGAAFSVNRISPMVPTSTSASSLFYSGANTLATKFPNSYGETLLTTSCKIYDKNWGVVGVMPSLLFVENFLDGARDSSIIDDVLVCEVKKDEGGSNNTSGNICFYIGG